MQMDRKRAIDIQNTKKKSKDSESEDKRDQRKELVEGNAAEVMLVEGKHEGAWVNCRITAKGKDEGTFNIHILPTEAFDHAAGWSDKNVTNVSSTYLRGVLEEIESTAFPTTSRDKMAR